MGIALNLKIIWVVLQNRSIRFVSRGNNGSINCGSIKYPMVLLVAWACSVYIFLYSDFRPCFHRVHSKPVPQTPETILRLNQNPLKNFFLLNCFLLFEPVYPDWYRKCHLDYLQTVMEDILWFIFWKF